MPPAERPLGAGRINFKRNGAEGVKAEMPEQNYKKYSMQEKYKFHADRARNAPGPMDGDQKSSYSLGYVKRANQQAAIYNYKQNGNQPQQRVEYSIDDKIKYHTQKCVEAREAGDQDECMRRSKRIKELMDIKQAQPFAKPVKPAKRGRKANGADDDNLPF